MEQNESHPSPAATALEARPAEVLEPSELGATMSASEPGSAAAPIHAADHEGADVLDAVGKRDLRASMAEARKHQAAELGIGDITKVQKMHASEF